MSDLDKINDILDSVDMDKIKVSINIATGLIAAGKEILEFLSNDEPVDEIKLLQIIEKHNAAKNTARSELIDSIARRRAKLPPPVTLTE